MVFVLSQYLGISYCQFTFVEGSYSSFCFVVTRYLLLVGKLPLESLIMKIINEV